jgi:hypothetical protein
MLLVPRVAVISLLAALSASSQGTLQTIPQQLARAGKSLTSGPTMPSGQAPSLDRVLRETDLIIRGEPGTPHSFLSADQTEVLTDYPILNATVLYDKQEPARRSERPTTINVTILGGSLEINGLTFTSYHPALPSLEQGREGLFFVRRSGERNMIAVTYYGAFAIHGDELVASARKADFAHELKGTPSAKAIGDLIERARVLHAARQ